MNAGTKAQRARGERGLVVGMLVGAALTTLGPLLAILASTWAISSTFEASETVDPSQKARILAQGISESMNFGMLAVPIGLIGFLIAVGCAVALWRRRRRAGEA